MGQIAIVDSAEKVLGMARLKQRDVGVMPLLFFIFGLARSFSP